MKLYDIVKWDPQGADGEEILIYKHEAEDFNTHTQLIVHASQEAIFFKDGRDLDAFDAGKHTLTSDNLPGLKKLINIPTNGVTPFHCEVYFINKIILNDLKWGTPEPILVEDPIERVNVHLRASGYFGAQIVDGRKFLRKVVGTRARYTKTEFTGYLRAKLIERVKNALGQAMITRQVGVLNIGAETTSLSDELKNQLTPFFDEYGINLVNFSFNTIAPLEEDLRAINDAKVAARKLDLESAARARMREREGYTYQQEHSFDVLKAAAQNEGTQSTFLGAGMGLGMGVGIGGAFGSGMNNLSGNLDVGQGGNNTNPKTQTCQNCGAKLPIDAKFCLTCGKEIIQPDVKVCPKCQAKLPVDAKFCLTCGSKLFSTCVKCGKELPSGSKFCKECGAPQD